MTIIIDKRKFARKSEAGNRKKLLERCRDGLRKVVDHIVDGRGIKDVVKKRTYVPKSGVLDEPSFSHNQGSGKPRTVKGNNKDYNKGDQIRSGKGGAGSHPEASDELGEFSFILTEKEFLEILFEDMELPDFIKESLANDTRYKWRRAGTTPDGPITKLNLEETLITALGRRFASKSGIKDEALPTPKKIPYITEEDLRYNLYTKEPIPIRKAVIFMMMDVSGSMGDHEKKLAKRFFLLLYLFLKQEYEKIDIRFIAHNTKAMEVDEDSFFNLSDGGGTTISSGYKLIDKIITDEYDITRENIYLAQVSDGDDFEDETGTDAGFLATSLLQKLQYFAYLEVGSQELEDLWRANGWDRGETTIYYDLTKLSESYPKVNTGKAKNLNEIFPVLKNLFKKRGK